MPYRDTKMVTARGQVHLRFTKRAAKIVHVFQCLIVSADAERSAMFEQAATEGGWKTYRCPDAATALQHIDRSLVQLAVVDLEGQPADAFRPVVDRLTATSGLLLIVCGNEGDIDEEVWVRQLGAWLYLPGVLDSSNIALLCGEAKHIAERLWKSNAADRPAPLSASPRTKRPK